MKLYLAHLGFYDERYGMYEIHVNKHVVAEDIKAAKQKLFQDEEFKRLKMHIDGIQEINTIDGYQIVVSNKTEDQISNQTYSHTDMKKV